MCHSLIQETANFVILGAPVVFLVILRIGVKNKAKSILEIKASKALRSHLIKPFVLKSSEPD